MHTPRLLTIKATAQSLSLSQTTVRDLIRRGLLKPNRVTRRVLIPVEQIDALVKGH